MTVLVTGGTGFVGSAVVRRLLAVGEGVRVLARPASDLRNLEGLDVELARGDLGQPDTLAPAVAGCEALFHIAADYRYWAPRPDEVYATNVEGTRALMSAAREAGVARVVYTSSTATLGFAPPGGAADEETPVALEDMIGHYKRSKFQAEAEVRRMAGEEGLPAIIVNPSTPVGPRDVKPTPTGRIVVECARGRMPAYVETGLNVVHVDDVAEGHLLAYRRGRVGDRYVLGGEDMSLREMLRLIAHAAGRAPPRIRLPHAAVLPLAHLSEAWARVSGAEPFATVEGVRLARKRMFFSSAKARRELGYASRPAGEALREAVAWFADHGYLEGGRTPERR